MLVVLPRFSAVKWTEQRSGGQEQNAHFVYCKAGEQGALKDEECT